ncbi:MAG TPA: hypothetical protein VLM37_04365, partial [Fibrobacteraceae bacterium]|nr:hypothetical protein [Fibrobacteraceae bacterium]
MVCLPQVRRIFSFLAILSSGLFAISQDTLRVGSLYQIGLVIKDSSSTNTNIIPVYNAAFRLLLQENGADADTGVLKIWSLKDSPRIFYASGDTFLTPEDSSSLDTCYGSCLAGWRYFLLTALDSGQFDVSLYNESDQNSTVFYSFLYYYPILRFSTITDEGDTVEITAASELDLLVGEPLLVLVEALRPDGTLDTGFTSKSGRQWLVPEGDSSLLFYSVGDSGEMGTEIDSLIISQGTGCFYLTSETPWNGGAFGFHFLMYSQVSSFQPEASVEFPGQIFIRYGDLPAMDSAAIYDTDGDGLGDSVVAWFDQGVDSIPVEPMMSWPMDSILVDASSRGSLITWSSGDSIMGVTVEELSPEAGTVAAGDFAITVTGASGNSVQVSSALTDCIGPVLWSVTILPGYDGAPDTLVALFNKELDSTFTSGGAFLINDQLVSVTVISLEGTTGTFVMDAVSSNWVEAGDTICIAVDGGLVSADGNFPASNNQEILIRSAGGFPPLGGGSGFYDTDLDGRMDCIVVIFSEALGSEKIDSIDFRFVWLDTNGTPFELHPDPEALHWSTASPERLTWNFSADSLGVAYSKTSIDNLDYGYGNLIEHWEVNSVSYVDTVAIPMQEFMAPMLVSAYLWPESDRKKRGDSLSLAFSEPVDEASLGTLDFLAFLMGGDTLIDIGKSNAVWSDSNRVLGLNLGAGVALGARPDPGDSVQILQVDSIGITDSLGNAMNQDGRFVLLQGDARVLNTRLSAVGVQSRAEIGDAAPLDEDGNPIPVSSSFWDGQTTVADLPSGTLGILLDISQSTLGDADSSEDILEHLDRIGMTWHLDIYTNLGGFVASNQGTILCNDDGFDGNCFENRRKVYLSWNLLSEKGRRAGFGVYVAQLSLHVFGADPYDVKKRYLWGLGACHGSG